MINWAARLFFFGMVSNLLYLSRISLPSIRVPTGAPRPYTFCAAGSNSWEIVAPGVVMGFRDRFSNLENRRGRPRRKSHCANASGKIFHCLNLRSTSSARARPKRPFAKWLKSGLTNVVPWDTSRVHHLLPREPESYPYIIPLFYGR